MIGGQKKWTANEQYLIVRSLKFRTENLWQQVSKSVESKCYILVPNERQRSKKETQNQNLNWHKEFKVS